MQGVSKWLAVMVIGWPFHAQAEAGPSSPRAEITGPAPAGIYVRADIARVDGGGVPATIQGRNPGGVTVTNGGDSRSGWRAGLGYQWADGVALQVSALDPGDEPVVLESAGATVAELDQAAETLHPQTARGVELAVRRAWYVLPDWRLSAGAGLWYWRSEWEVPVNGVTQTYDDAGIGPTVSLATGWRFQDKLEAQLGLHHLRLDDGHINTLGVGLAYQWGS